MGCPSDVAESRRVHEAKKLDLVLWKSLRRVGVQPGYDDDGKRDARYDIELRDCDVCGSTLARYLTDPQETHSL